MFYIHPEADPRDDDDENCWNVGLNKMETDAPIQVKFGSQTTIISYNTYYYYQLSNTLGHYWGVDYP